MLSKCNVVADVSGTAPCLYYFSAAVKRFEKMTQLGGTGIRCRIYPQGACNYINAAQ